MAIKWREKMSVDGGLIDQDHKHLIDIINRFEEISADGLDTDEANEILYALKFYTATHFEREEQVQRLVNYPYRDAHASEHRELITALDEIIDGVKQGEHADDEASRLRLNQFLHDWIVNHIIGSDLRMSPFIEGFKQGELGLGALKDVECSPDAF